MKDFNKYFIVGTNSDSLYDTMNGMVVSELIRCKDCRHAQKSVFKEKFKRCDYTMCLVNVDDFCSWAERRGEE